MGKSQVQQLSCEGVDALLKIVDENKAAENIYVLCSGSVDEVSGQSWCPDCVKADPVIENALEKVTDVDALFIHCSVGGRASWKDPQSAFRTHPKLKLTSVPTLLKWNSPKRLGDSDCQKAVLVEMFFEED